MIITAITKFKHGALYAVLKKLGWTQSELARRAGISITHIGGIINLHKRPTEETANKIQIAIGEAGEYIDVLSEWPESFMGIRPGYALERTSDIEMTLTLDEDAMNVPAIECDSELNKDIETAISTLPRRCREVVMQYMDGKTFKSIGESFGNSGSESSRVHFQKALRLLRKPAHIALLKGEPYKAQYLDFVKKKA